MARKQPTDDRAQPRAAEAAEDRAEAKPQFARERRGGPAAQGALEEDLGEGLLQGLDAPGGDGDDGETEGVGERSKVIPTTLNLKSGSTNFSSA